MTWKYSRPPFVRGERKDAENTSRKTTLGRCDAGGKSRTTTLGRCDAGDTNRPTTVERCDAGNRTNLVTQKIRTKEQQRNHHKQNPTDIEAKRALRRRPDHRSYFSLSFFSVFSTTLVLLLFSQLNIFLITVNKFLNYNFSTLFFSLLS